MKLSLTPGDVDGFLTAALPEFAETVQQHRAEWPDDPMILSAHRALFDLAMCGARNQSDPRNGMKLARRIYEVVERALSEGDSSVRDCFSIEMIEPLSGHPEHKHYPDVETIMGPLALKDLQEKTMGHALSRSNDSVG